MFATFCMVANMGWKSVCSRTKIVSRVSYEFIAVLTISRSAYSSVWMYFISAFQDESSLMKACLFSGLVDGLFEWPSNTTSAVLCTYKKRTTDILWKRLLLEARIEETSTSDVKVERMAEQSPARDGFWASCIGSDVSNIDEEWVLSSNGNTLDKSLLNMLAVVINRWKTVMDLCVLILLWLLL